MTIQNKSEVNKISKPEHLYRLMIYIYSLNNEEDREKEQLYLIGLDQRNNVKAIDLISMGSINECLVPIPEVLRSALMKNTQRIILVHNHPSGDPTPSNEDLLVTHRLFKACELIGITLIDHMIYTSSSYTSLRADNLIGSEEIINLTKKD